MKTLTFTVTIPNIPDGMKDEAVESWLREEISHPYDAAYEADVRVEPVRQEHPTPAGYEWEYIGDCTCHGADMDCTNDSRQWRLVPDSANPERENNGCMIHGKGTHD